MKRVKSIGSKLGSNGDTHGIWIRELAWNWTGIGHVIVNSPQRFFFFKGASFHRLRQDWWTVIEMLL